MTMDFDELMQEANAALKGEEPPVPAATEVPPVTEPTPEPVVETVTPPVESAPETPAAPAVDHDKIIRQLKLQQAKERREAKKLKEQVEQHSEYKRLWEEAVADGKDPRKLVEKVTGKTMDEIVQSELLRKARWEQATPEERAAIEAQQRTLELEARVKEMENENKTTQEKLFAEQQDAYKQRVMAVLEPAMDSFTKSIKDFAPTAREAGEIVEMVWSKSINDFRKAHNKGYELTPARMKKILERNTGLYTGVVGTRKNAEQSQQQAQQEQDAQNAAAAASQANYGPDSIAPGLEKASYQDMLNHFWPED